MLNKQICILTVGDMATDAFIRLKDPHIHCHTDHQAKELCMSFGDKIPFEYVKIIKAVGNSANVAVASARLGLRTAIVSNVGNDQNGSDCLKELRSNDVVTSFVKIHENRPTNYHFVLWYGKDRTILVNHTEYDYCLPRAMSRHPSSGLPPKWLYLTSLAPQTFPYHMEIDEYLGMHPRIKLAFQPGTFQIKLGIDGLRKLYEKTEVLILNLTEARTLLSAPSNRSTKEMLKSLASYGPKIVLITDSTNGSYMYDGEHSYHMPMYPDPRPAFERTGCGDAFAGTFISALAMGKSPLEALVWAPVNSMSVAQFVGSQEGLLTMDQLKWWLEKASDDYRPRQI